MSDKNVNEYNITDGFILVPDSLLRSNLFSIVDAVVLGKILRMSRKKGYCYASKYTLSEELGISYSTVLRSVKKLIEKDFIKDITPIHFIAKTQVRWYQPIEENINYFQKNYCQKDSTPITKNVDSCQNEVASVIETVDYCQNDSSTTITKTATTVRMTDKDRINIESNIEYNKELNRELNILIKGDRDVEEFLNKIPDHVISLESLAKQFIESPYDEMFELVRKSNKHQDFFKNFVYNLPDDVERKDDIINRYESIESNFENELPF